MIRFDVIGTPAPKGSSRAMIRGVRAVNVPGGSSINASGIRSWAAEVAHAAQTARGDVAPFVGVALVVCVVFYLVRPQGHYGKRGLKATAPVSPHVKPDLDKLVRATLDPLEGVLFDGDSRIVEIRARKEYAALGTPAGARIEVGAA